MHLLLQMSTIEHFSDFLGERHLSGNNGALWWRILLEKQEPIV